MKRFILGILLFALILAGCSQATATPEATQTKLAVSGGSITKSYTVADLQKLSSTKATFKDVEYVGVTLSSLLKDAGFDLSQVKAVKAVASDGFTVNYEPALFNKEDTLLAYARSDGALTADDGIFRMVLPGQEGKLNARKVVEIQVTQ
jgi:PBP1b-binding outer membrane lipoprotein LpoB